MAATIGALAAAEATSRENAQDLAWALAVARERLAELRRF
jgi:hypothetical protein